MNSKEALREARKRWGKNAAIREDKGGAKSVGYVVMGLMFAAFQNIEDKKRRATLFREACDQPCPRCSRTMSDRRGSTQGEEWPFWLDGEYVCHGCWLKTRIPDCFHGRTFERQLGIYWGVDYFARALAWIMHGQWRAAASDLRKAEARLTPKRRRRC